MTGHTLDDRAETVLLRLLRGSGPGGLGVLQPSHRHPIATLRRADTVNICRTAGIDPITDPTNDDPHYQRNRIRSEAIPLLDSIANRDVSPLLARFADHHAADEALLNRLAAELDPTDVGSLAAAPLPLAQRALRGWLLDRGGLTYPPSADALERVLAVVRGERVACEVSGGVRVERSRGRLRIVRAQR